MKIDLHCHLDEPCCGPAELSPGTAWNFYFQTIKKRGLDAVAITNRHDIRTARQLAQLYPQHVIVGCEYEVPDFHHGHLLIVVLGVTAQLHERLMHSRWQGVAGFTQVLREVGCAYFLAHTERWLQAPAPTAALIDQWLQSFYALETTCLQAPALQEFNSKLARYYQLASVGGSGRYQSTARAYAYTVSDSESLEEFYQHLRNAQVDTVVQGTPATTARFYQEACSPLRYCCSLGPPWFRTLGASLLGQYLQFRHRACTQEAQQVQIAQLSTQLQHYLYHQATKRIFSSTLSLEVKKQQWYQAVQQIHSVFCSCARNCHA